MKIADTYYRTIWPGSPESGSVFIIDQRWLPHRLVIEELRNPDDFVYAIREMQVRGAGLIGACAAFALYNASFLAPKEGYQQYLAEVAQRLCATRPTASNLAWAIRRMLARLGSCDSRLRLPAEAYAEANAIADEDAAACRQIGEHGLELIRELSRAKDGKPLNILTHCNAGWLAFVDYGSALSPVYAAHRAGIPVHVWVDETRPWLQGARLTAFELAGEGVPHTLISDNSGGHLMQRGLVDMVIVGSDRVSRRGDVANKIGTYLKALAAFDNQVPFYVALPSSTFDFQVKDGMAEIPIEERAPDEIRYVAGRGSSGEDEKVLICPENCPALNHGFDITPASLVSGLICERGVIAAKEEAISLCFSESNKFAE